MRVAAEYLPSQSEPGERRFAFVYRVVLENEGEASAKLMARHWIITDAEGEIRHVKGPGVVGKMPDLEPGERFEYMSGSELKTAWGTMEGSYQMLREGGERFEAQIGRFFLADSTAPIEALDESGV